MMEGLAGPNLRRWAGPAAVALFVGLPLLLAGLTLGNLARWSEAGSAAAEREERIAGIQGRIRAGAVQRSGPARDTGAIFLAAASGSLARAELQGHLVGLVERAGGRLIEVRGEDEREGAETLSVLLRASLDIGNAGLFDLVAAIETGLPLLTVEEINVRTLASRAGSEDPNPALRVALAIRGHRKEARP